MKLKSWGLEEEEEEVREWNWRKVEAAIIQQTNLVTTLYTLLHSNEP